MKEVYTFEDLQNWETVTAGEKSPVRLAVFGDPIAHSKSPQMQNAALQACGIDAQYTRLHIRPEELEQALKLLPQKNFVGVNLTIPHKTAALSVVDRIDENAQKLGAINTVLVEDGKLVGFNTDGPGIVRAIHAEFGVDVRDLRVMILGAGGGAGRAIAVQCALEGCERLVLVNRTVEKAEALKKELTPYFQGNKVLGPVDRLQVIPWETGAIKEQIEHIDLIINASSVGMNPADAPLLPASLLQPHLMVYDAVYAGGAKTKFVRAAEEAGARGAGGLSMLLYQGALAFELWFNREAPVADMKRALIG